MNREQLRIYLLDVTLCPAQHYITSLGCLFRHSDKKTNLTAKCNTVYTLYTYIVFGVNLFCRVALAMNACLSRRHDATTRIKGINLTNKTLSCPFFTYLQNDRIVSTFWWWNYVRMSAVPVADWTYMDAALRDIGVY